jgi:hypothetical protein
MLGMRTYEKAYLSAWRAKVDADVNAFKRHGSKELEAAFFNNLVLKMEYMFEHRLTPIEGKDGNPLNEVRVLANSIVLNRGKLQVDRLPGWPNFASAGIKLPPEKSVLGLKAGDEVKLNEAEFARLAQAFLAEIEKKSV